MPSIQYWYVNKLEETVPEEAPEVDWELADIQELKDKVTELPDYPQNGVTRVYLRTQTDAGRWRFQPLSVVTELPACDPLVLKIHNQGAAWCKYL
eukprot:jgi/Chrzof1/6187/Cz17g14220.t1